MAARALGMLGVALSLGACGSSAEQRAGFVGSGGETTDESGTDPGSSETTPGSGGTTPQPQKAGCAQAAYTEDLPTQASLAGLTFSSAKANDYLLAALGERYPLGKEIVEGGLTSSLAKTQGNCIDRYLDDKSSAASVLRQASTVVHECGHFFDLGAASGGGSAYIVRPNLKFSCTDGDTTARGGKTFARSRLKTDAYYEKRKACGGQKQGCDMYADVYLDGNPDDASFQGGDQGYNSVLEEANQYVNSLATALAFREEYDGQKASERDGILTFLWYIERYLKMAHRDYPEAYALLSGDACWRQATLSVWDRGWFYLNATAGEDTLGLEDASIEPLVKDQTLTSEIDALRKAECQ